MIHSTDVSRRQGGGGHTGGGRREGWVTLDTPDQGLSVISCSKSRHCRAGHWHILSTSSIKENASLIIFQLIFLTLGRLCKLAWPRGGLFKVRMP